MNTKNIGIYSGIVYVFITTLFGIIFIFFSTTYKKFEELSTLGVNPITSKIFNTITTLNGILLYLYFSNYLHYGRDLFASDNWDQVITLGKISAVGQIILGVFPNTQKLHYIHLFGVILFFTAGVLVVVKYSFLLHTYYSALADKKLVYLAVLLTFYAIIYPPFLRPISTDKGILQLIFTSLLILWHIYENKTYKLLHISIQIV